jgi:hypothetical protein
MAARTARPARGDTRYHLSGVYVEADGDKISAPACARASPSAMALLQTAARTA